MAKRHRTCFAFALFASVNAFFPAAARAQDAFAALRPSYGAGVARALSHFRARRFEDALEAARASNDVAGRLLCARALLALGRPGEAAPILEKLADAEPVLADHFRARAARAWLNANDALAALRCAQAVTEDTPVLPEAVLVQADAAFSLRRFAEARAHARRFVDAWPKKAGAAPALWILARACEQLGDRRAARAAERRIVSEFPASSIAARVGEISLSSSEALVRAEKLVAIHRNDRATEALRTLLRRKLKRGERCQATYLLGAALQRRRKHGGAFAAFRRAARVCGDHGFGARARYLWGKGLLNGKHTAGAARVLEALARRFPKHRLADDALLLAAQGWRRAGDLGRAKAALRRVVDEMPQGDMRPKARFDLARLEALSGDRVAAAKLLSAMAAEEPYVGDTHLRGRPLYALGKLHVRAGDRAAAIDAWQRCVREHPHTYWAALARGRLRALGQPAQELGSGAADASTPDALAWPPLPEALVRSKAFVRAAALIRIGAGDFAAPEVTLAAKEAGATEEASAALSLLYYLAGDWHRSHRLPRWKLKDVLAKPPNAERRRHFLLAYPRGFWDVLEPTARRYRVDPLLLVALVREESAFNATIESWANAVGLGQLIWPTARRMAEVLRIRGFHRGMLLDPAVNLRLAAKYLSNLLRRFRGSPPLAVAAYNAGELAVERWLRSRGRFDLDAFVEAIPYEQTRLYTRRVMESYATYRLLYGEGSDRELSLGPTHPRQRRR